MLPHLIFCDEDHYSPFTQELLIKLLPKLKDLGYRTFYDEASPDTVPHDAYERLTDHEREYKSAIDAYAKDPNHLVSTMGALCKRLNLVQTTQLFYEELISHEFAYLGIDDDDARLELSKLFQQRTHTSSPQQSSLFVELMAKRDALMATFYLEAKPPVVGKVGAAHVIGMQREIHARAPDEANRTYFIYVHHNALLGDVEIAPGIKLANLRDKTAPLSLELAVIDGKNIEMNAIVDHVLSLIRRKINDSSSSPTLFQRKMVDAVSPSASKRLG